MATEVELLLSTLKYTRHIYMKLVRRVKVHRCKEKQQPHTYTSHRKFKRNPTGNEKDDNSLPDDYRM